MVIPVYADKANAPTEEGSIIAANGDGPTAEGIYRYDPETPDYVGLGGVSGQDDPLAIPSSASVTSDTSVVVGQNATSGSTDSVAIGDGADAGTSRRENVAIGYQAITSNTESVAIGPQTTASASATVAIGGRNASATASGAVFIGGRGGVSTANVGRINVDQFVHGGTRDTIADADLNNGELTVELDETNSAFRLRGKDSGGVVREATIAW